MARFFRRNNLRLRPVNRIKHVLDQQLGLTAAAQSDQVLIETSDTPDLANNNEVETGSTVNGIYLNVEAYATTDGALANIYIAIMKNPGTNLTPPAANAVGISDNKRFVIHQEMKMLEQSINGNPRTIFNGVIVIPRGYRRFGPNDQLNMSILAPGVNAFVCYQEHFKEFR